MAHGIAEIDQPSFGEKHDAAAMRKLDDVDLRLDVRPFEIAQRSHLNFIVEMANVADDSHVLHLAHVVDGDDIAIAGGGYEDVGAFEDILDALHLKAVHGGLERADGIDLGDNHNGARATQRLGGAFSNIAIAADES